MFEGIRGNSFQILHSGYSTHSMRFTAASYAIDIDSPYIYIYIIYRYYLYISYFPMVEKSRMKDDMISNEGNSTPRVEDLYSTLFYYLAGEFPNYNYNYNKYNNYNS